MKYQRSDSVRQGWTKAAFGIGVGIITMLVATAGFAWLISREILGQEHLALASAGVLILGSFLGGISAGRGEGRLLRCLITGIGMVLILLVLNLLFCGGKLNGLLPGIVIIAGGVGAAALVGGAKSTGKRRKYRPVKYHNR